MEWDYRLLSIWSILLYPLPNIAFITKGAANNGKNPLFYLISALLTPFSVIEFINEEATGCINQESICAVNETVIGVIKKGRNPPSCFLFHVSLAPSLIELMFLVTLRFYKYHPYLHLK